MKHLKDIFRKSILHPRYLAQQALWNFVSGEGHVLQGRLLDVGCGKKPYSGLLSNVQLYVGLDVPTTMHGFSHADIGGTGLALPFQDTSFDSILCMEVLEHVAEPLIVLREMYRVTRQGGTLLLTVPLSEQLHEEPHDYYRFTVHALGYLLEKSHWKILKVRERGGAWLELGYRLSSFLYSSLGARRDATGALQPRPLLGPLVVCVCAVVQLLAFVMDKVWRSRLSTIGYGVIAQKTG